MKKLLVFMICAVLAFSLSSCASAKKTLDVYNEIGSITVSDERFLTEDERQAIRELREEREKAYQNRDVEGLVRIKGEWESMKASIQAIFDRYAAADRGLFTDEEISLLTDKEKKTVGSMTQEVREAYERGDREAVLQSLDELEAFCNGLHTVFSSYARIDRTPISDNLRKFVPAADYEIYEDLEKQTEKALKNRDAAAMEELAGKWADFRETLSKDVKDAQDAYLKEAVSGADFGGSLLSLFSLGTIESTTELQGHTIIFCVKYNYDVDEDTVSADLNNYLSNYTSYLQSYVDGLQKDISDVRLRVEYRNKNGTVLASKEFS